MKRPTKLSEYIGQTRIKPLLDLELKSGGLRPTLIYGISGIGKSSLANVLNCSLKSQLHEHVASESWDDNFINDLLMSFSIEGYDDKGIPGPKAVSHTLFIDECHSMTKCMTALLRPIEDGHCYCPDVNWLPKINYIFATDRPEKLSSPFMNRMKLQLHLMPYSVSEIGQIISFNFPAMDKALVENIAKRAKGVPRLALSFSESVVLYKGDADTFFNTMGIDEEGLDERDRQYLSILAEAKRPLSLNSLASTMQESVPILKMMESHLLFLKKLVITPAGRSINCQNSRGKRG